MRKTLSIMLSLLMLISALVITPITASATDHTEYEVGDHILYGNYPQSEVKDEETLSELNALDPTWHYYVYYAKGLGQFDQYHRIFMSYCDVTLGGCKYRGVNITEYRPDQTRTYSAPYYSRQAPNGYTTGNVYWFKYEPINWRILDPSTGLVLSESILDCQDFHHCIDNLRLTADAQKARNSNYYYSSIRKWLNDDFYNTAFNSAQKSGIATTHLESKPTYDEEFDSPDSDDKIFLLSYYDSTNPSYGFSDSIFTDDVARRAIGTDYAKSQGLSVYGTYGLRPTKYDGNSWWWLRSPVAYNSAAYIDGGGFSRIDADRNDSPVDNHYGVRAACIIPDLKSDISQPDEESEESSFCIDTDGICGDTDGDGTLTILDATAIQRHLVILPTKAYYEKMADADEDNTVTILDATAIQRYLANMPTSYNVGLLLRWIG